jgi:hypothetical protein
MWRVALALTIACAGAACGAFAGTDTPAAPDASTDAPSADGPSQVDSAPPGASTDASAPDRFVPPPCYVNDVVAPLPTILLVTPAEPRAAEPLELAASSATSYNNVRLEVCLEDGGVLKDHVNGPIEGTGPFIWKYSRPFGLPAGHAQAVFWGGVGANGAVPRATRDMVIAP